MKYLIFVFAIFILLYCKNEQTSVHSNENSHHQDRIQVDPGRSRPFVISDKRSAFFFGETGALRSDGHMGLYSNGHKYLDDYILEVEGKIQSRDTADSINVYFNCVERCFEGDIRERISLLENEKGTCLRIRYDAMSENRVGFSPLIPGPADRDKYVLRWDASSSMMVIAQKSDLAIPDLTYPPFLALKFSVPTRFHADHVSSASSSPPAFHPGQFTFTAQNASIDIITAWTENQIHDNVRSLVINGSRLQRAQNSRIAKLIEKTCLRTNDSSFDKAYRWALVAMDQLTVEQHVHGRKIQGIFAGLPWFNNFWGRDTFISLPGALLVTGRLDEAREVLRSFAAFQKTDSTDSNYGRIPNQATTTDIIYNTADGTPWFVRELWEYYRYSGDIEFIRAMYPVVVRSIQGTLKYHTDAYNLLIHGDADTWMDAKTNEGAWSPRGNRAIDIQALWYQQLIAGAHISRLLGLDEHFRSWEHISASLVQTIKDKFWNNEEKRLVDHLNPDDSQDDKIRPNQIFAITVPEKPVLTPARERLVLHDVISRLTYRYGVASLWQQDNDFHPYHQYPGFYPKDEAYHNGTVWCWLSGPVITSLCRYGYGELAAELLKSGAFQILDWGAAGTYSELLDAIPAEGQEIPRISGTVSQAWSLAEYLRNIHQDILGIMPDAEVKRITIAPSLSQALSSAHCRVPFVDDDLFLTMKRGEDAFALEIRHAGGTASWTIDFKLPATPSSRYVITKIIQPGDTLALNLDLSGGAPLTINGNASDYIIERSELSDDENHDLEFAKPELHTHLKSIQSPPYPLLDGATVKMPDAAAMDIVDETDPEFDDVGPNGRYTYPANANFQDGILDLTRFEMKHDAERHYFTLTFRNLAQPGWHPEYGFQLTFAAIAIDQGGAGASRAGRNANVSYPAGFTHDRIIYAGGGLQVEDSSGNILAAYIPTDIRYPLGDVSTHQISFAIPATYLGEDPDDWRFIILAGAQDDHGGAGIGEFRDVLKSAGDWHGGGGEHESGNCNVYDELRIGVN
ncbi:MAG: amylo-alpha-1,6-glucosidase [candidate division KSB1 bacterium]|jgi:glycogen debranching enzyme|nr:amylo-alpha-1,6-glucosidase [candidate division KSB1 bacterium]